MLHVLNLLRHVRLLLSRDWIYRISTLEWMYLCLHMTLHRRNLCRTWSIIWHTLLAMVCLTLEDQIQHVVCGYHLTLLSPRWCMFNLVGGMNLFVVHVGLLWIMMMHHHPLHVVNVQELYNNYLDQSHLPHVSRLLWCLRAQKWPFRNRLTFCNLYKRLCQLLKLLAALGHVCPA